MSLEKEIREKLIAEAADYKKLDQLVRQGMMSPAQLPMLHRGLDKMQSGKVLNPQEREAVNKVMQSMLYIVTGDSTVFQKAKQHTQKTRYQTEETVVEDISKMSDSRLKFHATKGVPHGSYTMKQIKDEHNERKQTKTYQAARPSMNEEEIEEGSAEDTLKKKLKKQGVDLDQRAKDRKAEHERLKAQYGQEEVKEETLDEYGYMAGSAKKAGKKKKYDKMGEESPAEDNLSSGYKAKFQAMLKKTGKSLKDMSDEEKKEFFNKVDAAHNAKDESVDEAIKSGYGPKPGSEKYMANVRKQVADLRKKTHPNEKPKKVEEGAMSRMATQAAEKERLGPKKVKGTGLETYKKKPKEKNLQASYSEEAETHVVKYTDSKGRHVNSSKPMTPAKAREHARKGNRIDKVGGKYTVHYDYAKEDAASDSEEMRAKTQRKLKRMSNMKARQEKETDAGYRAAVKEDAAADARRHARLDSKGLATTKKDKPDVEHKGKKAGDESHGGHIVMQLRKAVTINKPVKFKDGSSHNISKADAHKYMSKYMKAKPAEKEKMHAAHDSHDSFQKHINS